MIRPLGLVTLCFGYAEYELDSFLERLAAAELLPKAWAQRPIGQKLALLTEAIRTLDAGIEPALGSLLDEARTLLDQRNTLIHGCLRIPAKPGHRSDASAAIVPVDAGPVVKRLVDSRRSR